MKKSILLLTLLLGTNAYGVEAWLAEHRNLPPQGGHYAAPYNLWNPIFYQELQNNGKQRFIERFQNAQLGPNHRCFVSLHSTQNIPTPWNTLFHGILQVPNNPQPVPNAQLGIFYANGAQEAAGDINNLDGPIAFNQYTAKQVNPHGTDQLSPNNGQIDPTPNRNFITLVMAGSGNGHAAASFQMIIKDTPNAVEFLRQRGIYNLSQVEIQYVIDALNSQEFKAFFPNQADQNAINEAVAHLQAIFGIQPAPDHGHMNAGMNEEDALAAAIAASQQPQNQDQNDPDLAQAIAESRRTAEQTAATAEQRRREQANAAERRRQQEEEARIGGLIAAVQALGEADLEDLQIASENDQIDPRVRAAARERIAQLELERTAQPETPPAPAQEEEEEATLEIDPNSLCPICQIPLYETNNEDFGDLGREYCVHIDEAGFRMAHRFHINCLQGAIRGQRTNQIRQRNNDQRVVPLRCPSCNTPLRESEITNIDSGTFPACTPTARPQPAPVAPEPEPEEDQEICTICQAEINPTATGDEARVLPFTCTHPLHQACTDRLFTSDRYAQCPQCNARRNPTFTLPNTPERDPNRILFEEYMRNATHGIYNIYSPFTNLDSIRNQFRLSDWRDLPDGMQHQLTNAMRANNERIALEAYRAYIRQNPTATLDTLPNTQNIPVTIWTSLADMNEENIPDIIRDVADWRNLPDNFQRQIERELYSAVFNHYSNLLNPTGQNNFAQPYNTLTDVPALTDAPLSSLLEEQRARLQLDLLAGHRKMALDYYYGYPAFFSQTISIIEHNENHFTNLSQATKEAARTALLEEITATPTIIGAMTPRLNRNIRRSLLTNNTIIFNLINNALEDPNTEAGANIENMITENEIAIADWRSLSAEQQGTLTTRWYAKKARELIQNNHMLIYRFPTNSIWTVYVTLGRGIRAGTVTREQLVANQIYPGLDEADKQYLLSLLPAQPAPTPPAPEPVQPPAQELATARTAHQADPNNGLGLDYNMAHQLLSYLLGQMITLQDAIASFERNITQHNLFMHLVNEHNNNPANQNSRIEHNLVRRTE